MGENRDAIVGRWLRSETPENLELLTKLRRRLTASMGSQFEPNGGITPADVNESGTMTRDWCRAFERYQTGYHALLVEERERAKLRLMASKLGASAPLSDEEYEREMRELALEAVRELPTGELAAELAQRGLTMPAVQSREKD